MVAEKNILQAIHRSARLLARGGRFEQHVKAVTECCALATGSGIGAVYFHQKRARKLKLHYCYPYEYRPIMQLRELDDDIGIAGEAFLSRRSIIKEPYVCCESENALLANYTEGEIRSVLAVPMMLDGEDPIGVIQLFNKKESGFSTESVILLETVATMIVLSFINSCLVEESNRASQLLGMGKVAHDIKNLAHALEANVMFSDHTLNNLKDYVSDSSKIIKSDRRLMDYVDSVNAMFEGLTGTIDRVKRYSTLISDLSSGKALNPNKKLAPLAQSVQLGAAYLESEARSEHVGIKYDIQKDAPSTMHEDTYIFRIVQNLVSNAIRAASERIPERIRDLNELSLYEEFEIYDEVCVNYRFENNLHIIEIIDHGPGMSREMAERILRGNAMSHWQTHTGSGWGTKIVLELAATHHGKVNIESELGVGTTVRVLIPHQDS